MLASLNFCPDVGICLSFQVVQVNLGQNVRALQKSQKIKFIMDSDLKLDYRYGTKQKEQQDCDKVNTIMMSFELKLSKNYL